MSQEQMLLMLGNALLLVRRGLCKWKNHTRFNFDVGSLRSTFFHKNLRSGSRCFATRRDLSISCSAGNDKDSYEPADEKLTNAKVIYAVAPAMGHNQVQLDLLLIFITTYCNNDS